MRSTMQVTPHTRPSRKADRPHSPTLRSRRAGSSGDVVATRKSGLSTLLGRWLMALCADPRVDEPGGVIGLNGSLVAVLCVAYFVLIVCAVSYGQSTAAGHPSGAEPRKQDGALSRTLVAGIHTKHEVASARRRCVRTFRDGSGIKIPTDRPDDRRHRVELASNPGGTAPRGGIGRLELDRGASFDQGRRP
jgi:hypothetical protein